MSVDILKELDRLEALALPSAGASSRSKSKSKSKSKSAPAVDASADASSASSCIPEVLSALEDVYARAQQRIADGEDPETVLRELQDEVEHAKGGVDRGLKEWYGALGKVGKAIDKVRAPRSLWA